MQIQTPQFSVNSTMKLFSTKVFNSKSATFYPSIVPSDDYYKRFLTHPFVMPSERAFIDYFANHPSTEAEFPATKPDDAGREKTMYIVLEKVDTNLDHFLRTEQAENLRNIFTQL